MKAIAINASPRKNMNTVQILQSALDGAESNNATTKMIHLADLNFSGCKSCFACKARANQKTGECFCKDDLTDILNEIKEADILFLGSPFYVQSVTADMRKFLERLLFPYIQYKPGYPSLFEGKLNIAFFYTMNVTKEQMDDDQYPFMKAEIDKNESYLNRIFHSCKSVCVYDTYQFQDYAKYVAPLFDEVKKRKVKEENFPKDLQKAYEIGKELAQK